MASHQPDEETKVWQSIYSFMPSCILKSGIDFDVFTHISQGRVTSNDIAEAAGADSRAMRYLLDALAAMGYLKKPSLSKYALSPVSEKLLIKTNSSYIGGIVQFIDLLWKPWGRLSEVIRTGKPAAHLYDSNAPHEAKKLGAYLFPISYNLANQALEKLNIKDWKDFHLLDVASGAAPWGIAFAQQSPDVRVTAVDFPEVINQAKSFAERFKLTNQFSYLEGGFENVELNAEAFNAAVLSFVCSVQGEEWTKQAFKKIYQALKPQGRLLIIDYLTDDMRSTDLALITAVDLLVNTENGDNFTFNQFQTWLKDAGFFSVERLELVEHTIMAIKQ